MSNEVTEVPPPFPGEREWRVTLGAQTYRVIRRDDERQMLVGRNPVQMFTGVRFDEAEALAAAMQFMSFGPTAPADRAEVERLRDWLEGVVLWCAYEEGHAENPTLEYMWRERGDRIVAALAHSADEPPRPKSPAPAHPDAGEGGAGVPGARRAAAGGDGSRPGGAGRAGADPAGDAAWAALLKPLPPEVADVFDVRAYYGPAIPGATDGATAEDRGGGGAEAAEGLTGWREIESAPEDGNHVLLAYRDPRNGPMSVLGYFDGEHWCDQYDCDLTEECAPTHWMPLPPPPTATGGTGGGS